MQLSQRQKDIFSAVVELYSASGMPVGSKMVCDRLETPCSSATVRNEMSELINLGLLVQPHTSAGRIPSITGYRFFVDNILKHNTIDDYMRNTIDSIVPVYSGDVDLFMKDAGRALAALTNCAVVTIAPVDSRAVLKRIEIIPMSSNVFLVAVLSSSGNMKSRVCHTESAIKPDDVIQIVNTLNKSFDHVPLCDILPAAVQSAVAQSGVDFFAVSTLVHAFSSTVNDCVNAELTMDGHSNLFNYSNDFDTSYIKNLFEFLSDKKMLFNLLFKSGSEISVMIGDDSCFSALKEISIITAGYSVTNSVTGTIGIIGPVRLNYGKIIPSVEYFADSIRKQFTDWSVGIG